MDQDIVGKMSWSFGPISDVQIRDAYITWILRVRVARGTDSLNVLDLERIRSLLTHENKELLCLFWLKNRLITLRKHGFEKLGYIDPRAKEKVQRHKKKDRPEHVGEGVTDTGKPNG